MRILIIGAKGNIGTIITPALAQEHEVITAGRTSGDVLVDLSAVDTVKAMFLEVGPVDACVCVAGDSYSGALLSIRAEDLDLGIQQKLLGQVNLVLSGHNYINDGGSFTLISGKMGDRPAVNAAGKAIMNGGINSFVLAAALEMPRGIRINSVSPAKVADIHPGELIAAFKESIEGQLTGQIIKVNYH